VNQGLVVPGGNSAALKGYYKLNESLARLDLPLVDVQEWRRERNLDDEYKRTRSLYLSTLAIFVEEILFTSNEPLADNLNLQEMDKMINVYEAHRPYLDLNTTPFSEDGVDYPLREIQERLAYCGGVLTSLEWHYKKL